MKYLIYLSLSVWILATACNDTDVIGSQLLDNETIPIDYTDSIDFSARNILGDSLITFRQLSLDNYSASTYIAGTIDDNSFGKTEIISYFNVKMVSNFPNLDTIAIDSVIISLRLDTLGQYGKDKVVHNIELGQLESPMELDTMYSDMVLPVSSSTNFTMNVAHRDSLLINAHSQDTLFKVRPQLRLPIDPQEWIDLYNDKDTLTTVEVEERFPGYAIKSTASEGSLIGMDLQFAGDLANSNMLFYCTTASGIKFLYSMPLGQRRHSAFIHDYSGSDVEASINSANNEEDLFLQALGGTNIEFDLSEITNFDSYILNHGTIEIFALNPMEDNYNPIPSLIALYEQDNVLAPILDSDIQIQTSRLTFDGILEETEVNGTSLYKYDLDITSHLNSIKNGDITNTKMIIQANRKSQIPNRTILYGVNHPEFPAKLKLVLTQP